MCRLRAFTRKGVVTRIEQNYDRGSYGDPQANRSTVAWNPRGCAKGYTLHRRVYGPYRAKYPMVRAGWKEWADDGYLARGLQAVAATYSGEDGRRRLLDEDGYEPEMLEFWEGSGVRTMKSGSSPPVHGVAGKFSLFRFANMLSLLDADVRGVGEDEAVGARDWSEYT